MRLNLKDRQDDVPEEAPAVKRSSTRSKAICVDAHRGTPEMAHRRHRLVHYGISHQPPRRSVDQRCNVRSGHERYRTERPDHGLMKLMAIAVMVILGLSAIFDGEALTRLV
jgi:hypothetical protein